MMRTVFQAFGLVTVLACFVSTADMAFGQATGDRAAQETIVSVDPLQIAAALLSEGRWQDAITVLRSQVDDDQRAAALLFEVGMATLGPAHRPDLVKEERDALLDISIAAFQAILAADPNQHRVRLELARAFFLKEDYGLAKWQFERVLAGDIPPPVAANIGRFLQQISIRRRWQTYGGFALAPDTNINASSNRRTFSFLDLPFSRGDDNLPTSGVGVSLWGGWEYRHPLPGLIQLRFGGSVYRREYKGSDFDVMSLSLNFGPRWLHSRRTETSLLAEIQRQWGGSTPVFDSLGFRFEGTHAASPKTLLRFGGSMSERSYRDSSGNNGPAKSIYFGGRHLVSPVLGLQATLTWRRNRTASTGARTRSWNLSMGMNRDLARGYTLSPALSMTRTRYDAVGGLTTTDEKNRRDRSNDINIGLTKRNLTFRGFSPSLKIGRAWQESNSRFPRDYKRTYAELTFVRQF